MQRLPKIAPKKVPRYSQMAPKTQRSSQCGYNLNNCKWVMANVSLRKGEGFIKGHGHAAGKEVKTVWKTVVAGVHTILILILRGA